MKFMKTAMVSAMIGLSPVAIAEDAPSFIDTIGTKISGVFSESKNQLQKELRSSGEEVLKNLESTANEIEVIRERTNALTSGDTCEFSSDNSPVTALSKKLKVMSTVYLPGGDFHSSIEALQTYTANRSEFAKGRSNDGGGRVLTLEQAKRIDQLWSEQSLVFSNLLKRSLDIGNKINSLYEETFKSDFYLILLCESAEMSEIAKEMEKIVTSSEAMIGEAEKLVAETLNPSA